MAPELRDGIVGPGLAFNQAWKGEAEIAKTIVCGDSYFAEHEADAKSQILEWVKAEKPDFFLAGPAFNAGRYATPAPPSAPPCRTSWGSPCSPACMRRTPAPI